MPDDTAPAPESFGYRCIRLIADAKLKKSEAGQVLQMSEVAEIIDEQDRQRMTACLPDTTGQSPAEQVYDAYPRKVARKAALRAISAVLKVMPLSQLLERVKAFKTATEQWSAADKKFIPYPATWFNRGSYMDDPKEWERSRPSAGKPDDTNYSRF